MADRVNPFQSPDWDSLDAAALRTFLASPSGRRFIFRLRNDRPSITPLTPGACPLTQAGIASGYEMCVNSIFTYLTEEAPNSPAAMYPELDDDSQWPVSLQPASPSVDPNEPQPK